MSNMWARDTAVIVNTLGQSTTLQLAAYCVHCFLRQCMRVLTMAPPTPPSSFVSQGLRGQRLFGRPFGGVVILAFSNPFLFGGRAVERPRSNGKCSPEGCTFSGRGLAKRPPQGLKSSPEGAKMTSWRRRGALGGAVGRQMRSGALLGGAWGALRGSLGRLDTPRRSPGGLGRLREAAPGKDREPMLVLFLVVMQTKPGKVPKY